MFNFLKDFGVPGVAVAIITLVVFLYKRAKELQVSTQKITKEQLDAMIELYDSKDRRNNAFIVEQVFNFKFKAYIQHSVIQILLKTNNPTEAIQNYKLGKLHLELVRGENLIKYRKKMKDIEYRKKLKFIYITFYFILFSSAGGLMYSLNWVNDHLGYQVMILTISVIIIFLWAAYESLMSAGRVVGAERLMDEITRTTDQN